MHNDAIFDDGLNPKFVHYCQIQPGQIDGTGRLDQHGFTSCVEHAVGAWYLSGGRGWKAQCEDSDRYHVIRDLNIEVLNPRVWATTMRIDVWVEHIDTTSCVYGFLCSSEDGNVAYARGERSVIKIDPQSQRPAPWSEPFRMQHETLLKELPAYA